MILGSGVYWGYVGIKVCIKRKVIPKEDSENFER